jgi:hypothetical protein
MCQGSIVPSLTAAAAFYLRPAALRLDKLFLERPWARAVLPTGLFALVLSDQLLLGAEGFNPVAQLGPGDLAVLRLGTLTLATDLDSGGKMPQDDGGAGFVDLLPARAAAADEILTQILLVDAEAAHAVLEAVFAIIHAAIFAV